MFTNFLGYVSTKALRVALVVALGATLAALTAVALVVVSPAARAADGNCQTSGSEVVCTFGTPGTSIWTVPEGVTQATYAVSGAQGNNGASSAGSGGVGGLGGEAMATFSVFQPTSELQVNVGSLGGGGSGGSLRGGAGGGASDVRFDFDNDGIFERTDRIIVGGGGGGGGGGTASGCGFSGSDRGGNGGSGGGLSGNGGNSSGSGDARGGGGGTQAGGGSGGFGFDGGGDGFFGDFGNGGNGGSGNSCGAGGGGGGDGYYGGGGGGGGDFDFSSNVGGGGGGGGSGYVQGQGTDVQFRSGVQSGNGKVTITYTLPTVPPDLFITDTTVSEGNSGTSQADFTVSLSEPSMQTITVAYATSNGTATAGEDYLPTDPTGGTLTFGPADTSKTISVLVNGDSQNEPDETFFVNLSNPANATLSDAQGKGTINNDDQPPDTTAPMVSKTSPVDNGTMDKADLVTATFSEEVKGVSEQTFFLKHYTLARR